MNEHDLKQMAKPLPTTHKMAIVNAARALMAAGHSLASAAVELRVQKGSLSKWLAAGSLEADYSNCGRPRKFALTEGERLALRGLSLKHGSFALAIELFRDDPECSSETRAAIIAEMDKAVEEKRRCQWPQSLRDDILPRAEEEALFRGAKAFEALSHAPRKGMFWEDEEGREVPITPLDVWSMDDYSTNQPYIVETAEGPRLCRQTLACMDLYSAAWLSVEMIGRERDAYRAEDIVRFILRTIEAQGTMPLCLMLERGRWESKGVHGIPLDDLGKAYRGQTWGGLDALFTIVHGYSSRHKAQLESSFNMLQSVLAHSGRDIGRVRGEFERATKLSLAVAAGRKDPRACGFLEQDASRRAHWQAMQLMNGRQRERSAAVFEGRALVPNDLLMEGAATRIARPLPADEAWRFLPLKRLATVRNGFVEVEATHYGQGFRFEVNGISELYVSNGHRVLIAFDPATPGLGCYVANAVPGAREGWAVGERMLTARHAMEQPQFSMRTRRTGEERSTKGRANATARTAFAGVNPHKLGMTHTQAHDGEGGAKIARTGKPMTPMATEGSGSAGGAPVRGVQTLGGGGRGELAGDAGTSIDRASVDAPTRAQVPIQNALEIAARRKAALAAMDVE